MQGGVRQACRKACRAGVPGWQACGAGVQAGKPRGVPPHMRCRAPLSHATVYNGRLFVPNGCKTGLVNTNM